MAVVNILLTHPEADEFEPFEHDETAYQFVKLSPNDAKRLIEGPVWIFVDWLLEELAGLEFCRRLRADPTTAGAHITMVLEENSAEARKRALDAGADDYMIGPIDRRVILDRILAVNPAATQRFSSECFQYGALTIDASAYRAYWKDTPIAASPNEFRLLRFLAENANQSLTRAEIVAGLGKDGKQIDERSVDVSVRRLRQAILGAGGGNPLRTVRSVGYVFDL